MSAQAFSWALERRTGSPSAKSVLCALANYAGECGQCYPSLKTLAHDTEQSAVTVRRRIHELSELGFVAIFERSRESGAQTSSEYVVLFSDAARRYAQQQGWVPDVMRKPVDPLDVVDPLSNCEGGTLSDCEGAPLTGDRGPLSLVRGVYEPRLESRTEHSPPNPPAGGIGEGPISGSGERQEAGDAEAVWERDWRSFDAVYPWQFTDRKQLAREVFTAMPPDDRVAAIKFAPAYAAAARAANRKIMNAANWLRGRGWDVLADAEKANTSSQAAHRARFAGKVWVEAGTAQAAAWRRHRGGASQFYYDRKSFDGQKGHGRAEASEWPPGRSAEPVGELFAGAAE